MRAKKVDSNQKELMKLCRQIPGVSVVSIHTVGNGVPDIILGCNKKNYLIEIKDGEKVKSAKKLTPDEEEFHRTWQGQVCIAESIDDIFKLIKK